ncbi:MAG TPA: DUF2272 domain-containing protein [Aliidongia sp.]|uniref:DUF2272 domain-containing protein n=1 Tax=Aliidongia sp. TaxID=1914230 RepID=UPI002DDCA5BD|nr:DUF2272 domain-containing protein [Aliidongia sp.]HEV2676435.1 DUF2272 domain-containing protein [Aliidongia sp.]
MPRPRCPTRFIPLLPFVGLLIGCATPNARDGHVPDFARRPYEPFSRTGAVAIALREWRLFGSQVADEDPADRPSIDPAAKAERLPGLWQRVGEYWWLGLDADDPARRWTGKHDAAGRMFPAEDDGSFAWSAAFISYVMRIAGAGRHFPYSASHSVYIDAARATSLGKPTGIALWAEPADRYAPQAGDLVCFGRDGAQGLRFEDLPAGRFASHCAIVVAVAPGEISVVGGNVEDTVALTHVPVTAGGVLTAPGGGAIDPRYPWSVVLRVLYDE